MDIIKEDIRIWEGSKKVPMNDMRHIYVMANSFAAEQALKAFVEAGGDSEMAQALWTAIRVYNETRSRIINSEKGKRRGGKKAEAARINAAKATAARKAKQG